MIRRIFLIATVGLLVISVFLISRSDFFTIKSVDVQTDKVNCADSDQIKNSSDLLGQNIFFINSSKSSRDLKVKFLCIKDVKFSRYFPNRINLFASGREAKAILLGLRNLEATQSSSVEGLEVDEEGVIFAKSATTSGIPKIYLQDNLALDQKAPGTILDALKILEKVKLYGLDVTLSEILNGWFIIYEQPGNPRIVFKLEQNLDTQLASLQLILKQAKIDEKVLEFIDLRFDKPVVRLAPKKHG